MAHARPLECPSPGPSQIRWIDCRGDRSREDEIAILVSRPDEHALFQLTLPVMPYSGYRPRREVDGTPTFWCLRRGEEEAFAGQPLRRLLHAKETSIEVEVLPA